VPNYKSVVVPDAERKHVRRRARDLNNMETQAVFSFFSARQGTEGIHAIVTEISGELAPSYATVKNWVAQFKCVFPPVMRLVLDDP